MTFPSSNGPVSIDFGSSWQDCELSDPVNRLAWQRWTNQIDFPQKGYYEVWARATDENGHFTAHGSAWVEPRRLSEQCFRID